MSRYYRPDRPGHGQTDASSSERFIEVLQYDPCTVRVEYSDDIDDFDDFDDEDFDDDFDDDFEEESQDETFDDLGNVDDVDDDLDDEDAGFHAAFGEDVMPEDDEPTVE